VIAFLLVGVVALRRPDAAARRPYQRQPQTASARLTEEVVELGEGRGAG
jgi:hypothetical protein